MKKKVSTNSQENWDELIRLMDEAMVGEAGEGQDLPLHRDPLFLQEKMKIDFLEDIHQAMESLGINAAELARRMNVSRARVAKILNETSNFQMETMARMAAALNRQVAIRLYTQGEVIEKRSTTQVASIIERIECEGEQRSFRQFEPSRTPWMKTTKSPTTEMPEEMLA